MLARQELIDFFKALASEKRQEILIEIFLDGKPHTVTEVSDLSHIALSTASTHLSILKRAKILVSEKIGKDVHYRGNSAYMAEVFTELAKKFTCC
ncbi:MAG: helix-turn-helix domain-containing protein [Candidatus Thiodiazotropha sp. (ex Dulcina madagascariensis)]|nr:helix-turn-helix domain-containing protein [Candidatus Thiodiazotropha sp. (ex Epidulcina cf. delphinae)]MCU7923527.1 helix-turn-helix domain-containing protein [Candidatus Thiodiazotropha sp. (ex Dulcina madagascariensis)]MCU7926116.1 helix-turn-helix domain-containing protein [Candidatus Thiodiazotropha sp. (ex Dulcina madagascariensis)]MCU7937056.1 helix-turn-helix domain-containing protein [Candidatus Thiodiazotropha sp. (ex Dulcina madagascariensis)]